MKFLVLTEQDSKNSVSLHVDRRVLWEFGRQRFRHIFQFQINDADEELEAASDQDCAYFFQLLMPDSSEGDAQQVSLPSALRAEFSVEYRY